ncbi:hypothetical protein FKG94_05885 [Exilibacterium tricleocarpae]|uniref:Uncharacterized protein n=1 Tax=Exilibacterium tricleocarpae TaxID=2591008 RepID=A0A545U3X9_9GAMM|nr:hypothetical protein [Exilibacterium tricleocarpae]TQV84187.1 hypothetical protein FKG94_05885 [Exilibacterium tricleocarpae]
MARNVPELHASGRQGFIERYHAPDPAVAIIRFAILPCLRKGHSILKSGALEFGKKFEVQMKNQLKETPSETVHGRDAVREPPGMG